MTQNALKMFRFVRLALMAGVGFPLIFASNAFAQLPAPAVPAEPGAPAPSSAEVERVVVTGSNIPTAEETGPNPVDTYRPQDIEKLGIRSATDLQQFIPQQAGGTVNLNIGNGGDGTIQFNLRGILPKETLVLIDGKRVAYGSLGNAGGSAGPDINLIPFSMVDHVDILKDGASAGVRLRRDRWRGQFLLDPQIPRSGGRNDIREHKHGRLQRDGRVERMDQSGHRR